MRSKLTFVNPEASKKTPDEAYALGVKDGQRWTVITIFSALTAAIILMKVADSK